jgi:hypothetical protein
MPVDNASARTLGRRATALTARTLPLRRFVSPASLLLALVLFPLPWIDVRCDRPLGERGSRTLVQQSGLQAAYGGYTEAPIPHTTQTDRERIEARVRAIRGELILSWSPLMVAYPLVLLGGIVLGVRARRHQSRTAALVACCVAAGLLLWVEASWGFPLERAVRSVDVKGRVPGADVFVALSTSGLVEVGYTKWFWLSAVAVGGALAAAGAEWWLTRAQK